LSHRLEQLTSALDRGVREVFARGFSDPRIGGLITVTNVRILPDLSQAIISISVLPQEKEELTLHGLSSAAKHIRREVGELVNTRTLPQFTFRLDSSIKKEAAILKELDRVRSDLATRPPPPAEPPAPADSNQDSTSTPSTEDTAQ
jgi:ribosome-binding factor A